MDDREQQRKIRHRLAAFLPVIGPLEAPSLALNQFQEPNALDADLITYIGNLGPIRVSIVALTV